MLHGHHGHTGGRHSLGDSPRNCSNRPGQFGSSSSTSGRTPLPRLAPAPAQADLFSVPVMRSKRDWIRDHPSALRYFGPSSHLRRGRTGPKTAARDAAVSVDWWCCDGPDRCCRRPRSARCQLPCRPGPTGDPGQGRDAAVGLRSGLRRGHHQPGEDGWPGGGLTRLAEARLDALAGTDDCAHITLQWEAIAADGKEAFTARNGDPTLVPAGDQITALALAGAYRPQSGRVGAPGWTGRSCASVPRWYKSAAS